MAQYNSDGVYIGNLEKHKRPEGTFYVCPKCGQEYLADFFYDDGGRAVCIDCSDDDDDDY